MTTSACCSFHGDDVSLSAMVGLGRAAFPQLGVGRGCALPTSFSPGPSSPASEQKTALDSQTSHTSKKTKK